MKILFCIGTRPEIIKCWPVYKAAKANSFKVKVFYTNQNYEQCLSSLIFKDFKYEEEDLVVFNNCGLDQMFKRLERLTANFKPNCILVQGDTWSALYGAILAVNKKIKLGHIEAGLRSYDPSMIEEKNRIMIDNLSDYLFTPTEIAFKTLRFLHFKGKVFLTGNTIADLVK